MKAKVALTLFAMAFLAVEALAELGVRYIETYTTVITFDFLLGDETLSAGTYRVFKHPDWELLVVCREGVHCSTIQIRHVKGLGEKTVSRLGFHWDGAAYRLALMQCGRGRGYLLPRFRKGIVRDVSQGKAGLKWVQALKNGS